jgi:hypothetical protein
MFLAPLFLIAAGVGAAIPFILHLMQNRRRVRMPFPTIRFLKLAEKNNSRKIRLENFLLWLLRTLIMISLGAAFAMPMFRTGGFAWLGETPRDVAIVIDASYSMGYQVQGEAVWNKAIESAVVILEGLREQDRFCIFLAREQPEPIIAEPIADKQEGIARLRALQLGESESRILPAVSGAMSALLKTDSQREHEIHIITDNQALPWTSPAQAAVGAEIDHKAAVFILLLGVSSPENTAISGLELQPPVARQGSEMRALASLRRSGAATDSTLSLFVNDREISRKHVPASEIHSAEHSFTLPLLEAGVHTARIQIPDDNLPADNSFYFLVRVQEQMPSLIVGNDAETLFLRTALRTGYGNENAIESITPNKITEKPLSRYSSVFLCDALPLFGQAIGALETYVKAGGVLVIFPGISAKPDAYASWNCLPGMPLSPEDLPLSQRNRTLTWDQPQHSLIRTLREGIGIPTVAVRRKLTFDKVHASAKPIVSMGANQPFLLEREFGAGHVLMFSVAADRTWSDFPLSPFFLPLLIQCADSGVGAGPKAPFDWATEWLPLSERFPDWNALQSLIGPSGQPVSVRASVLEGRNILNAENLTQPGFYSLKPTNGDEPTPVLAINLLREESDLTQASEVDIRRQMGAKQIALAHDLETLRTRITEHRVGRTFGEHLLWLALALIALEFSCTNILGRAAAGKKEKPSSPLPGSVPLPKPAESGASPARPA